MRNFIFTLTAISGILSCSSPNQKTESKEEFSDTTKVHSIPVSKTEENLDESFLDTTIQKDVSLLNQRFAETPFYASINGSKFYIVSNRKWNWSDRIDRFGGAIKYGIVDDSLRLICEVEFDKIYNPNLSIKDCFEVKKGGKVGLINYRSKEILEPQFDFILKNLENDEYAFGYKDKAWFEIQNQSLNMFKQANFDPTSILEGLTFNIMKVGKNMIYNTMCESYMNEPTEGCGVVIVPSYIEYFDLLPTDAYTDVNFPNQTGYGTVAVSVETIQRKTISDKLVSVFYSIYQEGIDARGYQIESNSVLTYNKETNVIESEFLSDLTDSDQLCRDVGHLFVNDTIIEIKSNKSSTLYDFETTFSYLVISEKGEIKPFTTNRHFASTKLTPIREYHFRGCFAKGMDGEAYDDYNYWRSDHLSIEDLDLMRNEIFAEYGYKFQSEKWKNYFLKMPWYKPLYDNVDEQLTEIDKANIKTILKVKEEMEKDEQKFTNRRPIRFYAAG